MSAELEPDEPAKVLRPVPRELQDLVGQTLGDRYRVEEVIGVGGMGVVFRGFHLMMKRTVAIKVARPRLDPAQKTRFRREAELGGRLDHRNCIRVHEFNTSGAGLEYMVMAYVEGRPLSEYLDQRLSPQQATAWTLEVLRGLEHAHDQGIVHRDVKPQNVLLTHEDGVEVLKLADFGLAKITENTPNRATSAESTMSGLMAGTPAYMAPEQALAMGCDERSDLYSVGMMLYRMVVGELPYANDDAYDALRSRLTEDLPPLPTFVPAPLARIIDKMLRGKKERRYRSAGEVVEDLSAFLDDAPLVHASTESIAPPPASGVDFFAEESTSSTGAPHEEADEPASEAVDPHRIDADPVATEPSRGRGRTWLVSAAVLVVLLGVGAFMFIPGDGASSSTSAADPEQSAPDAEAAIEPPTTPQSLENRLARLIDVEELTDAERHAASQLAFASQFEDSCAALSQAVTFVEKSRSPALLQLLPRVGAPEGEGCEGLAARIDALRQPAPPSHVPATPAESRAAQPEQRRAQEPKQRRSRKPRSRAAGSPTRRQRTERAEPVSAPETTAPTPKSRPAPGPKAPKLEDDLQVPKALR